MGANGWRTIVAAGPEISSQESAPPGIVESLQRDARWCGGDLMAAWVVGTGPRVRACNRWILWMGVIAYGINVPLWAWAFTTLLVGMWRPFFATYVDVPYWGGIAVSPWAVLPLACWLAVAVLLPKVLGAVIAMRRGWPQAWLWAGREAVFSAILAPTTSLFHARFFIQNLLHPTRWDVQVRSGDSPGVIAIARDLAMTIGVGVAMLVVQAAYPASASALGWFTAGCLVAAPWVAHAARRQIIPPAMAMAAGPDRPSAAPSGPT